MCLRHAIKIKIRILESKSLSASGVAASGGRGKKASAEVVNVVLYGEGIELLIQRVGLRDLAARSQIAKWLMAIDDGEELAEILAAARKENLQGHQFIAVVDQRVTAKKRERERGAPLPFGFQPNVIGRKASP